jgi:hypothetical protein
MEIYARTILLILIFGFFLQFKFYGAKYFLPPSIWFFLIWIFSVTSFIIFISAGLSYIVLHLPGKEKKAFFDFGWFQLFLLRTRI